MAVYSTVTVTGTWQRFTYSNMAVFSANGGLGISLRGGQNTSDSADVDVYAASYHPAAVLPPYVPTTTLQSIPDLSGNGNTLYRGSNTSAYDTNDPTVLGPGLSFVTDDYALTGNLSGVDMAGDWTAILVGLFNGEAGNPWSLAANDESGQMIRVASVAGPALNVAEIGTGSATTANLAVSSMEVVPVVIEARASGFRMYRMDTGATTNTRERHSPVGVPRLGLGCRAGASPSSFVDAMTTYSHLFYNRVLSDAEINRIYRVTKGKWAGRNISIL